MDKCYVVIQKLIAVFVFSAFMASPSLTQGQFAACTNLEVILLDDLTGYVYVSWDLEPDTGYQFTIIKRNGIVVGTSTACDYSDHLNDYGTTCYSVIAFYDQGLSEEITTCIDWFPPEILIIPDNHIHWLWPSVVHQYISTIHNLGPNSLSYDFPGFSSGNPPPGFIVDVQPASGIVAPGSFDVIVLTWNTSGYVPGTYFQDVICESNDPVNPTATITNELNVYTPAYVAGIVIDTASQIPVPDVEVTVDPWQTYTDNNGSYCLALDEGSYMMEFSKFGYPSVSVLISPTAGDTLIVDVGMHSFVNVSAPANAEANIVDYPNGIVEFTWELEPGPGYHYVILKKNGIPIGTVSSPPNPCILIDALSDYGSYCYSAAAYYSFGLSAEASSCVEWVPPGVYISPDTASCSLKEDEISYSKVKVFNNRSSDLTYSFPGFDIGSPPPGFIAQVNSAYGVIPPGDTGEVFLTFDASAYSPGVYYQDVVIELSDTVKPTDTIPCIMDVYFPGYVSGVVYFRSYWPFSPTYIPLAGLRVIAGTHSTRTFEDGSYVLDLPEGDHEIYFEMPGYRGAHHNINIVAGSTTFLGDTLFREPEPVSWFTAQLDDCANPDSCILEWGDPIQAFEFIYDDGTAEDLFAWPGPNNENAVRITPLNYPAQLTGGSMYVGDGSFPAAYWIGTDFSVRVYDLDNTGLPGTLLDSITVPADKYYWVGFNGLDANIDSGDFFLSIMQLNPMPDCTPIGIDMGFPLENRSYSRMNGGGWTLSGYQDFMIRAEVMYSSDSSVLYHTLSRMFDFDPELGPASGSMSVLNNVTNNLYVDEDFPALPPAWYAYSLQTNYGAYSSKYAYSNIVGNGLNRMVAFEVRDCLGNPVENVEVIMYGLDWPMDTFIDSTNVAGNCTLECVWLGEYDVDVDGIGYQQLTFNTTIANDTLIEIILNPLMYPPRNLWVDSVTATAYWDEALITAVYEKFEDLAFPPDGWQSLSQGAGWSQSMDGGSLGFFIPSTGSRYAFVNDDLAGAGNNACCDMLITPELDLRDADNYTLSFDSYYTGVLGQMATIEYSLDNGGTWDVLYNLMPAAGVWEHLEIDLSSFSEQSIWFAFHGDDGGGDASGWAIDNVDINAGPANPALYAAFIDGALCAYTDTTYYKYEYLTYGVTYTACAAANYSCGYSEYACADFTSGYLMAPYWLQGDSVGENIELSWKMDTFYISQNILGYHVYRDSINIAYVPYIGEDTSYYTDVAPPPMCYDYHVSTLYDLSAYGFPGDTGESQYTGPEEVCLVYGTTLPIIEDWASGSFGSFWTAEDNWVVNGQFGNPHPCAEFTWDPMLMDYQQCLTSGPINGVVHGTKSEPYSDGQFILNFDISLVDNSAGGTEYFNVEVWSDGAWNSVEQFSNANGNFNWENVEVDITEYALGYVFKVRFMAEGENSSKIISWFLDNIEVYHYCASPENLYYEGFGPNICELYWSPPIEPMKQSVFQSLLKSEKLKKSLIGYNLFWKYDMNPYSLLDHTVDSFYTYYLPEEGSYFFYVTAVFETCESGASNEIWVPFPPPSGIDENSTNNIIQVFPNPTSDMITVESSVRMSRLCLLDYSGRSLQCHELQNQIQTSLDVSSYEPGIYLLRVDTEEGRFVRKLVVAR